MAAFSLKTFRLFVVIPESQLPSNHQKSTKHTYTYFRRKGIFFYRALVVLGSTHYLPNAYSTKMARHSFTLPGFNNLLFDNR